ncbi:MAG: DUF3160 domain-containing protein [Polyangiaceae bacterium]
MLIPFLLIEGCASSGSGTTGSNDPGAVAGTSVDLQPATSTKQELKRLTSELSAQDALDAPTFAARSAVPFGKLGAYEPTAATGMDVLQKSAMALQPSELSALSKNGFVVSAKQSFPSFMYGYQSIYSQDLPLYVSADSILYAVHQSYDAILSDIEQNMLTMRLDTLLSGMQSKLASAKFSASLQADTDVYVTTARSLLAGSLVPPTAARNAPAVKTLYNLALAAAGNKSVAAFGLERDVDFSQFTPRGHYTATPELEQYFRAMIWLGRIDLRVIDTAEDGSPVFRRNQLEGAVALRQLMDTSGKAAWSDIDSVIGAFVGEHDDMTPPQVDGLLNDLGVTDVAALSAISDEKLAQTVIDGSYGAQRIASQIVVSGPHNKTLPLARSFAFMGQRYVLDSEVFSNVVYDRVLHDRAPKRLMPNPLDVAYAALGNDQAGMLLAPELEKYAYAPELADMRVLADAHGDDYWQGSLYNTWLGALRTLSPTAVDKAVSSGLPSVAATDAWGRRLLNTQLASWSELRHDTLLYAKPSYTSGAACSFPAAYVDPYPAFFAALVSFAERGKAAVAGLPDYPALDYYFTGLSNTAATLRDMATDELQGAPLSAANLAFINRAIHITRGCDGTPYADGWYADLFYSEAKAIEFDPSIADVHTQPTDEAGADVGHVLHVATGMPQLMVVTVDSCAGAQAYVGLASSYYEHVTDNYERLTDPDWSQLLMAGPQPRPAWLPDAFVP